MKRLLERDPRIVERDIEVPELRDREIDESPDIGFDAYIGTQITRYSTLALNLLLDFLPEYLTASAECNTGPFSSERHRGRTANAGGRAGDHDDLVGEALL
jgi:hypothetical protein